MPCLFRMEIRKSEIQGTGMYSLEDIPKGEVYWVYETEKEPRPVVGYDVRPNKMYTKEGLYSVKDEQELKHILHTGFYYADGDVLIQLNDGTEFTNHSNDWNSQIMYHPSKEYRKMYAVTRKEVKAGDEITGYYGNYLSSGAEWVDALMNKYLPDRKDLENQVVKEGNKANDWKI